MIHILQIDGLPTPWTSVRVTRARFAFNPRYKEKEYARWQLRKQWGQDILECPLSIQYIFCMPIPTSVSNIKKNKMLENELKHTKRPDVDNLQKFCSDCLTSVIIKDDSQIWKIKSEKIYSLYPKTVIQIET